VGGIKRKKVTGTQEGEGSTHKKRQKKKKSEQKKKGKEVLLVRASPTIGYVGQKKDGTAGRDCKTKDTKRGSAK